MNDKILEIYTSEEGLSKDGYRTSSTHLCFDSNFLISRTAFDQYQTVKSCVKVLEDVLQCLEEEVAAEHKYFEQQAEEAVKKLWETKP
jgi:hypothetical protein